MQSKVIKNLISQFKNSYGEFKSTRMITTCAMFAALGVIIGSFTISFGNYMKIGFSSIANQCVYALYGPVVGFAFGGMLDILKYIIKPTGPFFFGFTFNAMLAGAIYGVSFYKKTLTFKRILITELIVAITVNIVLNTLWISVLYGKGFIALLPMRVIKNLIQWPFNAFVFFMVSKMVLAIKGIRGASLH